MRLLLAFVVVATIDYNGFVVTHEPVSTFNGPIASKIVDSLPDVRRFRRAVPADTMKQSVERMQMTSRLTNAIYLQKGLVNGTKINPEKLISELLHFGSFTPSNIHSINEQNVNSSLTELGSLPDRVKVSKGINDLEAYFGTINSFNELMPDVTDVTSWPGIKNFTVDMTNLKDGTIDMTFINSLDGIITELKYVYSNLIRFTPPFDSSAFASAMNLKSSCEKLLAKSLNLTNGIPELFKFTNGKTAKDSFAYITQISKGVDKLFDKNTEMTTGTTGFQELNDNVEIIKSTIKGLKGLKSDLQLVKDFLVTYSIESQSTPLEYTIGLPGGYSDINLLFDQFHNPWFKSIVKDQKLEDALSRLKLWRTNVDNIQNRLDKITEDKINKIFEVLNFYNELVKDYSDFDIKKANATGKCAENVKDLPILTPSHADVDSILKPIETIDTGFTKIKNTFSTLRSILNSDANQKVLNEAIKVLSSVNEKDDASLTTAIGKLQKTDISKIAVDISSKLGVIAETYSQEIIAGANTTLQLLPTIDTYLRSIAPAAETLNCILGDDTRKVKEVVSRTETLRGLSAAGTHKRKFEDVLNVVNSVVKTRNDLKALDTSMKGMKGFKSKESDLLNLLVRDEDHYKVIGLSTEGVVVLKRIVEGKSDLDALKIHANLGKDETSKVNNLSPAEKNLMDELASVGPSLDPFYKTLDIWIDQLNKQNFTTLANYSLVFKTAKNVTGPDHDYEKMDAVLGKLIASSNNKDSLKKVREAVRMLIGTGLKHASYTKSYDQSEKSLEAMDLFFAKFSANVSATPAPTVGQSGNRSGYGSQSGSQAAEKSWFKENWKYLLIGAGIVIVVMMCTISYIWWNCYNYDPLIYLPLERKIVKYQKRIASKLQLINFIDQFEKSLDTYAANYGYANPDSPKYPSKPIEKMTDKDFAEERRLRAKLLFFWSKHIHRLVDADMKEGVLDFVRYRKNKRQTRHIIPLVTETRVLLPTKGSKGKIKFKTDYIHGNFLDMRNGAEHFLFQGPIVHIRGKKPNVDKLWYLVKKQNCKRIYMLCNFKEGIDAKCCKYFPLNEGNIMKGKGYTVRCVSKTVDKSKTIKIGKNEEVIEVLITRKLLLKYDGEEEEHEVTHKQYTGWPDHSSPNSVTDFVSLLIDARNGPATAAQGCPDSAARACSFIHCSGGIGRTGTFSYTEMMYLEVAMNTDSNVDFVHILQTLRKSRARSIQEPVQLTQSVVSLIDLLIATVEFDNAEEVASIRAWRNTLAQTYSDVVDLFNDEPAKNKKKKTAQ